MGAYEYPSVSSTCSPVTERYRAPSIPHFLGQTVTFTAQLSSTSGVPTGTVQFTDGNTVLGTETISSTGVSTFSTGQLAIGSHIITATYQPSGILTATSATLTQVVNGDATTTNLTCSPTSIPVSSTALLSATVMGERGSKGSGGVLDRRERDRRANVNGVGGSSPTMTSSPNLTAYPLPNSHNLSGFTVAKPACLTHSGSGRADQCGPDWLDRAKDNRARHPESEMRPRES
jgi:hypothetical protein